MCAYKAYEDMAYCKFNHNYQPIFVSSDVEHIMLIAYIISRREINLYVRQIFPLSPLSRVIPSFKGRLSISMSFGAIELHQLSM